MILAKLRLDTQLVAYLSLRQSLGFQMQAERVLLPEFVTFVKNQEHTGPIRAQLALEWACQESIRRGPGGAARRLSIARGFLLYLQASAPDTEVPALGLLPSPRRPKPFIFTPAQITALMGGAQASRPQSSLRPHTLSCLLGLLASTGLRVGEVIRLQIDQVKLELVPPQLHILETKFHKSRIVPLHPSTAEHLRQYREQRTHLHYDGLSDAFLVSEQGQHLKYRALHDWFTRLCQRLAIQPIDGRRPPCLSSFRHTFAVTRMQRWYEQGLDVPALLPHLSVYLGHVHPQESYWYITSVPELLSTAANRFETFAQTGGTCHG
jgi:integrase/recombinase XerD